MSDVYLYLSAGNGPKECEWALAQLARVFVREARADDVGCELMLEDDIALTHYPSLLIKLSGRAAAGFAHDRIGTIRWIGTSPFRPNHKRRNWYVAVSMPPEIKEVPDLQEKDIHFQTMRASGPGGQHVNKTDSAVRATHVPSGTTVVAKEERSQHMNKKLALTKLALIFAERQAAQTATARDTMWQRNRELERGNEVRTYKGPKFKRQ